MSKGSFAAITLAFLYSSSVTVPAYPFRPPHLISLIKNSRTRKLDIYWIWTDSLDSSQVDYSPFDVMKSEYNLSTWWYAYLFSFYLSVPPMIALNEWNRTKGWSNHEDDDCNAIAWRRAADAMCFYYMPLHWAACYSDCWLLNAMIVATRNYYVGHKIRSGYTDATDWLTPSTPPSAMPSVHLFTSLSAM